MFYISNKKEMKYGMGFTSVCNIWALISTYIPAYTNGLIHGYILVLIGIKFITKQIIMIVTNCSSSIFLTLA